MRQWLIDLPNSSRATKMTNVQKPSPVQSEKFHDIGFI